MICNRSVFLSMYCILFLLFSITGIAYSAVDNIKIETNASDGGYVERESSWPNYAAVLYDMSGSQIAAFDIWDDMARDYPYETSYAFNLNQLEETRQC
jgi:hypothetical protein